MKLTPEITSTTSVPHEEHSGFSVTYEKSTDATTSDMQNGLHDNKGPSSVSITSTSTESLENSFHYSSHDISSDNNDEQHTDIEASKSSDSSNNNAPNCTSSTTQWNFASEHHQPLVKISKHSELANAEISTSYSSADGENDNLKIESGKVRI